MSGYISQSPHAMESQARHDLVVWSYPFIFLLGISSNLLNLWILFQPPLRHHVSSLCLMATAVADFLVLVFSCVRYWVKMTFHVDWQASSETSCHLTLFMEYFTSDVSVWCLCVLTGQRFLSIILPFHSRRICNTRNTLIVLIGMAVFMLLKNSPIFHFSRTQKFTLPWSPNQVGELLCNFSWNATFYRIFTWLDIATKFLLPFPLLLVLNVLILVRIRRASRQREMLIQYRAPSAVSAPGTLTTSRKSLPNAVTSTDPEVFKMWRMVLSINLMFLLCYMPFGIFMCIDSSFGLLQGAAARRDRAEYERYAMLFQVCVTLVHISHATNFFLYVASGNRFRRVLYDTLKCKGEERHGTRRDRL